MSSEAVIAEQTYLLWSLCPCAQPHLVGLIPREESVSWPVLYKGIRREGHGSEASTGTRMQRQWFWAFFYKKGGGHGPGPQYYPWSEGLPGMG